MHVHYDLLGCFRSHKWMGILKIAADYMDYAMDNKRLNMGEVVGEMMDNGANPHSNLRLEYKTIQFDILGMSVSQKMTKLQNAWKICIFCNSEKFQRGDPWKKNFFSNFLNHFILFWEITLAYCNGMGGYQNA